jgi:FixJ family two-component response regulator
MMSPTVFLVDDDRGIRESVADVLIGGGYKVALFESAEDFLARADLPIGEDTRPTCLILDVCLPAESGVDLQQRLALRGIRVPTVFMTAYGDVPTTVAAMKGGAIDFLLKPVSAASLLRAVQIALASSARTTAETRSISEVAGRISRLTRREREVFELIACGLLNKQIAARLRISLGTVKAHRGRLVRKLAVTTVAELVRLADRVGSPTLHGDLGRMAPAGWPS